MSQATAYEAAFASNPQARMALSILASLSRQSLQQVRDLASNLRPTLLEALAAQEMRSGGVQIRIAIERQIERSPAGLELLFFRAAQDILFTLIQGSQATHITLELARRDVYLVQFAIRWFAASPAVPRSGPTSL